MPWIPELFSAPLLQQVEEKWGRQLVTVPFFDGVLAGDVEPLVKSFAGEPELHHPVRGRIKGVHAFEAYVKDTQAWLRERDVSIEDVEYVAGGGHGFAEVVLHLDGGGAEPIGLPVAVVSDRTPDGRIAELRMYYCSRAVTGHHVTRPPLLQPDPHLRLRDVVAEYHRALTAGDAGAIVAAFEPDGYAREPGGDRRVHQGPDALRAFYEQAFANHGGIALEHCTLIDDGGACALEYNIVRWGETELAPQAGIAVHVRGPGHRLAAARMYDDVDPPSGVSLR
jgi:ketosteroid isomerase-like protein